MPPHSLSEGSTMNITLTVSPGWRWQIGVIAEDKTVDFDLSVSDSKGNIVALDDSPDADAYCTIDAKGKGRYRLLVASKKGSGQYTLDVNPVGPTATFKPAPKKLDTKKRDTEKPDTEKRDKSDNNRSNTTEILKQGLTNDETSALLQAHNDWRAKYGVKPMEWCETLTEAAQNWAQELAKRGFKLEHSPAPPRTAGENVAYGGSTDLNSRDGDLTAAAVVDLWGKEVNDYNYKTNTCAAGKVCGHYTQVVWAKTKRVGGGMVKGVVEDAAGNESIQEVWVCQYDPPGNYVGEKPY